MDVLEAAIIAAHDAEAPRRMGDSRVHVHVFRRPPRAVTGAAALLHPIGALLNLALRPRKRVEEAFFEVQIDTDGIQVNTGGPHVAMQYDLLAELALLLAKWGHISIEDAERAVTAMAQT